MDRTGPAKPARTKIETPALAPLLITYLRPQGARVAMLALCLATGVGLQLLAPQLTSRFIDLVAKDHGRASPSALAWLAGLFIAATIAGQLVRTAGAYFSAAVGWGATNRLRLDLARHCLALDMAFTPSAPPAS